MNIRETILRHPREVEVHRGATVGWETDEGKSEGLVFADKETYWLVAALRGADEGRTMRFAKDVSLTVVHSAFELVETLDVDQMEDFHEAIWGE